MTHKINALSIIGLLVVLVLSGCAMEKHRKYVREGLLVTGLNREAFLLEWGSPDRTGVISGGEILKAGWRLGEGFVFKGKQTYNVWTYETKGIELVFYGVRLVAWKTEKTVDELKSLTPPKPKTLDEHLKEKNKE